MSLLRSDSSYFAFARIVDVIDSDLAVHNVFMTAYLIHISDFQIVKSLCCRFWLSSVPHIKMYNHMSNSSHFLFKTLQEFHGELRTCKELHSIYIQSTCNL